MKPGGRRCNSSGLLILSVLYAALPVQAKAYSLLPLMAQEAQTLPSGVAEVTVGAAYFRNLRYPFFTPPAQISSQHLLGVPQMWFRIGAGAWAEIQLNYELIYLNETTYKSETNQQYGSGDIRVSTKAWFARDRGWKPAIGVYFLTKLPNAISSNRLGTDDMDFLIDVLLSKTLGPVTAHANLGLALLGNSGPTIGEGFDAGGQDDLFSYDAALVSSPLAKSWTGTADLKLMGELNGFAGSHYYNNRMDVRLGAQWVSGPSTIFFGASAGLINGSEKYGLSTGFTYAFDLARLLGDE